MTATRIVDVARVSPASTSAGQRTLAVETPIAIEYNGIGYAVMMATPDDLEDFAIGFSLSEGLIDQAADILGVDTVEDLAGCVLRVRVAAERMVPIVERARRRITESSCGLCGLETLAQVLTPLAAIRSRISVTRDALFSALDRLQDHQPLNVATGAAHGAAFCLPDGQTVLAREDVGRHNALDKLIGALARNGRAPSTGFFLLTARCSYELVEKTIRARCPLLVTVSAPTSLAVERAIAHDLTLVALARRDAVLVANDPHRMFA